MRGNEGSMRWGGEWPSVPIWNPGPTFLAEGVRVASGARRIGADGVKLVVDAGERRVDAVGGGMAERSDLESRADVPGRGRTRGLGRTTHRRGRREAGGRCGGTKGRCGGVGNGRAFRSGIPGRRSWPRAYSWPRAHDASARTA